MADKKVVEAASKAVVDFRTSVKYEDEKIKFFADAYVGGKQWVRDRIATKYPELNLNFLDELWEPTVVDVPTMDTPAPGNPS